MMTHPQFDIIDGINRYEAGEMDSDDVAEFFQTLIDAGYTRQLQGSYQRAASELVAAGYCHW